MAGAGGADDFLPMTPADARLARIETQIVLKCMMIDVRDR